MPSPIFPGHIRRELPLDVRPQIADAISKYFLKRHARFALTCTLKAGVDCASNHIANFVLPVRALKRCAYLVWIFLAPRSDQVSFSFAILAMPAAIGREQFFSMRFIVVPPVAHVRDGLVAPACVAFTFSLFRSIERLSAQDSPACAAADLAVEMEAVGAMAITVKKFRSRRKIAQTRHAPLIHTTKLPHGFKGLQAFLASFPPAARSVRRAPARRDRERPVRSDRA